MSRIMMRAGAKTRPLSLGGVEDTKPVLCSAITAWSGVPFEVHRLTDCGELGECGPLAGEHGVMVVTEGAYEISTTRAGRDRTRRTCPGSITFMSGDERPYVREIRGSATVVAMHLTPDWLRYASIVPLELRGRSCLAGADTARVLAASMQAEVANGCVTGRVYAESLSLTLVSFAYGLLPGARVRGYGRLRGETKRRLERYMRDQMHRNLTLQELAKCVGLQPRQFSHCFGQTFGTSPHRYLTELRLREAASLLRCGKREIVEVALSVGFSSQSHFTTAFRRQFGVTPRAHVRRTSHHLARGHE
jgi:AraC family transcriptional regulator